MMNKMEISMIDIFFVLLMLIVLTFIFDLSHDYLLVVYGLLTVMLAHYDIVTTDRHDYGQKIYKRTCRGYEFSCTLMMIAIQIILYTVAVITQLHVVYYCLAVAVSILVSIRRQLVLVIYKSGIKYRGKFYDIRVLKDGHVVKNYKEMYEIHLTHHKVELNKTELILALRSG